MSITNFIILQVIAHLLSEFVFQSDNWKEDKTKRGFKGKYLVLHFSIVFLTSWILSFELQYIYASFAIASLHWLIDFLEIKISKSNKYGKYAFVINQSLHLLAIIIVVAIFEHFYTTSYSLQLSYSSTHRLLIIAGYILCTKPANVLIKEVMKIYSIKIDNNDEIMNAGKLIGNSERILSLTLILFGQFAAVGFIIAGKSIIRYKDTETKKTEYVLVGTLLSFGIAILTGIGIQYLSKHLT